MRAVLICAFIAVPMSAATLGRVVPLVGGASDVVLDEVRGRVYLTATTSNLLQIYSLQRQSFQTAIPTDQTPLAAALSRNGKVLYVACYNSSVIDVIDLDALIITTRVSLPTRPEGVAVGSDGRVLISTAGSGTTDVLLLYDPSPTAAVTLSALAVTPPAPAAPTFPPASGRPFLSKHSQLVATRNGSLIAGVNVPAAGPATVFVYESASATVLRARAVAGSSTALAISDDGTRIASGSVLFDAATLLILGQQNVANVSYPIPPATSFTLATNQGGGVFSPDTQTLYLGLNVAPVQGAVTASQLMLSDPDNLLVHMGIQLPENLAGRMVISADGSNAYALSDSGFAILPLGTIFRSPLAVPATTVALLNFDPCGVNASTAAAAIAINNAGTGRVTATAQLLQLTGQVNPPSPLTAPSVRNSSSGFTFSYNASATRGLGTVNPPHDFLIQSPEAINIPDHVRVYENSRVSEARGSIVPIPTNIFSTPTLADLVFDQTRQRLYIANAGFNRIEIYDLAQQKLLPPVKVGQLPSSMALTPDGSTLYVANVGAETVSMVDPDKLQIIGTVSFPPISFGSTLAPVTPVAIAAGLNGPQVLMSNSTLWKIVGTTAFPRPASVILGATPAVGSSMAATPGGEFIILSASNGFAYLYDASLDDWVAGRQIFTPAAQTGYIGPVAAGPRGQYFVVNGTLLNQSLVPVSTPFGLVSAVAAIGDSSFAIVSPPPAAAANALPTTAPTVQLMDANSGNVTSQVSALEGPATQIAAVARATAIAGRTLAIDPVGATAYAITTSGLSIIPLVPVPAGGRPQVNQRGAVSLATLQLPVSSNGLLAILGQNLAATDSASSTPLPTTLGGTCVTLNNIALPLFMTSATEIHAQIPPNLAAGSYPLVVHSLANHAASTSQTLSVSKYAPAALVDGSGQIALFHADGNYVNADNPANRDEPLTMYAVGLGPTTGGAVVAGTPSPSSPLAQTGTVQVFFGNPAFVQAGIIVDWSGLTPGLIGVYQLNLRVPGFHIKGDALPVTLRIGGANSSTTGPLAPHVWVN
ncbi:MAG TPA: hypothetical protein VNX18_08440 [Bryobacteraceae bacterium]|nr:hypothetical protein [Bryobacteraceae bacterium]